MKNELICVVCPNGCLIDAEFTESNPPHLIAFEGHKCPRGENWVRQEIENPMRTFSSSVLVKHGNFITGSVRTTKAVPLSKVMTVMEEIRKLSPEAPISVGDVLLRNPAGVETDIIATRSVDRA